MMTLLSMESGQSDKPRTPLIVLLILSQNRDGLQFSFRKMQPIPRSASLMSQGDSEKLQFFFSCRNLADLDTITVTDSFLVVRLIDPNQPPRQVLRTKVVMNSLNPDYYETAIVDYEFEVKQILQFEVYHDGRQPVLVGRAESSVGEIFGHREKRIIRGLVNQQGKQAGKLIVRCQVVPKTDVRLIEFQVAASRLPDMKVFYFFGNNSPFFRLMKRKNNQNYLVYQSEVIEQSRHPQFKRVKMNLRKLCDNDERAQIQCQLFNYSARGNHDLMGEFFFTVAQLGEHNSFSLTKKGSKIGHSQVIFGKIRKYRKYDFTEFISAGLEMQLVACVDFTGSNGVPNRPESLHFIGSSNRTAYEEALKPVGEILLDYDADKLVPLYGFGAKVRLPTFNTQGAVHHCFPLNGQTAKPQVYQVQGILSTYRNSIKYLEFGGPTVFTPLLLEAMQKAKYLKQQGNQYMIVLILTDGQIHDMQDVCHQLVQCARLPISIIVVGIGNGDFKLMQQLDDDDMQMTDKNGKRTERDLVQFVPFRDYSYNGAMLAKNVLEELPRQVVEYHELCGITPEMIIKPIPKNDSYVQKMMFG